MSDDVNWKTKARQQSPENLIEQVEQLQRSIATGDLEKRDLAEDAEDYKKIFRVVTEQRGQLSWLWLCLYESVGELEYLDEAIRTGKEVAEATPTKPEPFVHLGICHWYKFNRTSKVQDAELCLDMRQRAMGIAGSKSKYWWMIRHQRDELLHSKYLKFPDARDLQEAISSERNFLEEAIDHPLRASAIELLARLLCDRWKRTDSMSDLREAIENASNAVKSRSSDVSSIARRARRNYSTILFHHYNRTRDAESLKEARRHVAWVLEHEDRPDILAEAYSLHGLILVAMYEREHQKDAPDSRKSLQYLDEALELAQKGIGICKQHKSGLRLDDVAFQASMYDQAGSWTGMKSRVTEDINTGKEAIRFSSAAIEMISDPHPIRPFLLSNQAVNYVSLFGIQKRSDLQSALQTIRLAIRTGEAAVKATDAGDPNIAQRLNNLGAMEMILFSNTGGVDEECARRAESHFLRALEASYAPPLSRMLAGIRAGRVRLQDDRPVQANETLQKTMDLIPSISPRSISAEDLQDVLSGISGLSVLAASAVLSAADPAPGENHDEVVACKAIQTLESARCVMSTLSMDCKSDVTELRDKYPELCEKYEELRAQVSCISRGIGITTDDALHQANAHHQVVESLSETETTIRKLPGFKNFQRLATATDLKRLAKHGPLVTFNVERFRSDVIVVDSTSIKAFQLPTLEYDKLLKGARLCASSGRSTRSRKDGLSPESHLSRAAGEDIGSIADWNPGRHTEPSKRNKAAGDFRTIREFMQWLWTVAVKPVLGQLQLTSSRRVWWVTSGLMGTIPIHAAGDYKPNSTDDTMSMVISSYISSFKALAYARQAGSGTRASSTRMLEVTMPTSPGHARKLDTSHETRAISQTFDPASITALEGPTPAEVLSQLPSHTFAHFGCHGFALARDPARGGLLLVDDDGGRAILTIEDLNRTDLERARVAYLAACSTAETSSERLLDEAISLANAFQTAGFRHVVGTLWDADDYAAGKVAEGFYGRLFEAAAAGATAAGATAAGATAGDGDGDAELGAAKALHESVLKYRGSDGGRDIRKWGSFVYVGV